MPSAAMFAFAVCSVTDSRRYACWRNCCGEYSFEWSESNLSSATDSGAIPPYDSTANAVNLYSFTALIAAYFECFSLTAEATTDPTATDDDHTVTGAHATMRMAPTHTTRTHVSD